MGAPDTVSQGGAGPSGPIAEGITHGSPVTEGGEPPMGDLDPGER